PEHIKRPSNCFILFRADLAERMRNEDKTAARRTDGGLWKGMSASERKPWVDRARRAKDEHQLKHPNYQFRPQKRE
ncbi:high mobility group box domain-containing protein, partial [Amylostereum chailletii]